MQIIRVGISNYRNLDGVNITFDPQMNFLIGENELGKSNLLYLFEVLFNRQKFSNEDFLKRDESIRIDFSLRLCEAEKGTFEDHFAPDENDIIDIEAIQEYSDFDEEIKFFWKQGAGSTPIEIPNFLFRRVNYIFYDSLRTPRDELTFYKGHGGGRFLSFLLNEFANTEIRLDVDAALGRIISEIQSVFSRLKPLKRQGLGLYTDKEDSPDFASRILKLSGTDGFDIQKSGYGIQFSALLLLSILERFVRLKQNRRFRQFEERREYFTKEEYAVFEAIHLNDENTRSILAPITREEDKKYYIEYDKLPDETVEELGNSILDHIKIRKHISMVLGLDEPEIHLHPYTQRSLIKYIASLIQNKDIDFLFLIKKYFDIDFIDGQFLVVSHSPTVLLDEYKTIVRFFKDRSIAVVSGTALNLDTHIEKHLLLAFSYLKEAFFARCVILVEGETEAGAIPLWASKIIGDLDEQGIVVVGVGGLETVPPVATLLNHFNIPNVSIIDKDNDNDTNGTYTSVVGLRTTIYRDFEEELYEAICSQDGSVSVLFDFLEQYGNNGLSRFVEMRRLTSVASKYGILETWDKTKPRYTFKDVKENGDTNLTKTMFLAWMTGRGGKTITLGRALGQFIGERYIPAVYTSLFTDAKTKVTLA